MKKNKRLVLAAIFIVIIAAALLLIIFGNKNRDNVSADFAPGIVTVISKTADESIDISGNVEAVIDYDVVSYGSGIVSAVFVNDGDFVDEGKVLIAMDDTQQKYELESAKLSLAQAEVSGSESELYLAQLKLAIAEKNLEYQRVYCPVSGIVTDLDVNNGDFVSSNKVVARIISPDRLMTEVSVDEIDITDVKVGQKARLVFDALPDETVYGHVTYVAPYASVNSQGIAVVTVRIVIDSAPRIIRPGFSFSGEIVVSESAEVLLIEKRAVSVRNDEYYVLMPPDADSGRPSRKKIKVEEYDDTYYRVLSGLNKGDSVLIPVASASGDRAGGNDSGNNRPSMFGPPMPGMGPGRR